MFTRKLADNTLRRFKVKLKKKGFSYRSAAPVLGVHYAHLSQVLNGHRQSRRLLKAIDALQQNGVNQ